MDERFHGKEEAAGSTPVGGSKRDTKAVGDLAEAMVLARFIELGWKVSIPFGEGHRYDLVVDDGSTLGRVQVKTGRLRQGAISFPTCSSHYHRGGSGEAYTGQIEAFAVYCPDTRTVYMVPVDLVGIRSGSLRVEAPRNAQVRGVRLAADFLI